jgi:sphinganine-1-phosphate aldolase
MRCSTPPGSRELTLSFHLCATLMHTKEGIADEFLKDLREGAQHCRENPAPPTGSAAMYGMSQSIPDRSLVDDICRSTLDCFYEENSTFKPAKQAE